MADKTTGELDSVKVEELPAAPDIYDDFKMPGELQGEAVHVTGAQMRQYAVAAGIEAARQFTDSVKVEANSAKSSAASAAKSAETAVGAKTAAQSALTGVQNAIKNIPAGSTPIVNNLTTGGATMALSAEMGKTLGKRPNPNFVINGYLSNPVNQRGQSEYSGETQYTVDCWEAASSSVTVLIGEDSVIIASPETLGVNYQMFGQTIENKLAGKKVTASVLVTECVGSARMFIGNRAAATNRLYSKDFSEPGLYTITGVMPDVVTEGIGFQKRSSGEMSFSIAAVKIELGDTQTLAHQDELGNWVLNEIPNYGEELLKCQRYYQIFSSANARPAALVDYRPNMRTTPKTGTVAIGGTTYYYADASL